MPYRCLSPLPLGAVKQIYETTQRLQASGRVELHITQANGSIQVMPAEWVKQVHDLALEVLSKRPEAQ